ncbi:glycosyltransferase [Bremerella alba]|uniref:Glycosyl transferase family 1 domain-containing protein n=1 Tax=Bremerella alba TaxID=980252 RepID=A0A7V9A7G2_9BACT|nr:glycosyltransferase [Bremerella alba]MBA2114996.1 hypothetical protein [Bremerella alba]
MKIGLLHAGQPNDGIRRYSEILSWGFKRYQHATIGDEVLAGPDPASVCIVAQKLSQVDIAHVQLRCLRGSITLAPEIGPGDHVTFQFFERTRAPIVATIHDVSTASCNENACQQIAKLASMCCQLLVFTRQDREKLLPYVPSEKLYIMPHFVEPRRIVAEKDEAKRMLGLPDTPVITVLGKIYFRKGYHVFLEAFSRLPQNCFAVLAGRPADIGSSQSYAEQLVSFIEKQGLVQRIRITGYLPDELLDYYLAATDLAVCPFLQSAASGSISSWISHRKPVLASDLPSLREYDLIAPGAIQFCPPNNSQALADAIQKQLEASNSQTQNDALKQVHQVLQLKEISRRHHQVYRRAQVVSHLNNARRTTREEADVAPKRFALISHPRCGTHMLRTMLMQHPGVDIHDEIFNDESPKTEAYRQMTTSQVLHGLGGSPRGAMPGFLLHLVHGVGPWSDVWQKLADDPEFRFIALKRRNHLARFVSMAKASQLRHWQVYRDEEVPKTSPVYVDPLEFEQDCYAYDERWNLFESLVPQQQRLTVWYEELDEEPEVPWRSITNHLQLDDLPCPEPKTIKVGDELRSEIANYEQLENYFKNSPLEACFANDP